ncbi:MAG: carboxypeptidase-like regulatory domain-containing protein [Bacteroidetes bacterium]|nr:carboxypeptidase-like regulatory domain-containing protein [Bacteroidota bacterium]
MKALNLIAAILITSTIMFASNEKAPIAVTTTISGQILDKTTGEALAGVKIEFEETVIYSDLDGNFEINNVVPGTHKINTSLISYNNTSIEVDCKSENKGLEIKLDNE